MSRPVVGIDPSLTSTGYAGADGVLATITSKPCGQRVADRARRLTGICQQVAIRTPRGSLVIIEGPSYAQANQGGEHLRAGLWWRLATVLDSLDCQIVEVPPTSLKKFATGRGNARKDDMRMALYKRTGLDYSDDNQVDALWLRQIGLHLDGDPDAIELPAAHLAALEKVRLA